jgi:RNA polymerase sigma factor for flagellar operon FliA
MRMRSARDQREADESADLEARDRLALAHTDLVRSIAFRIGQRLPAHVDRGDLVSVGMIGLLEAAARYRPSTGVPFEAFARRRVHGAIMDSLRELDWVPRSVRALQRRAAAASSSLRQELGREPLREEVAATMGLDQSTADVTHALQEASQPNADPGDLTILEQTADPGDSVEKALLRAEVAAQVQREIARLPQRERLIIDGYYRRDQTMGQIGASIGVCESRVSQLRSGAVARLRETLSSVMGEQRTTRRPARFHGAAIRPYRPGQRPVHQNVPIAFDARSSTRAVAQAA